MAFLNLQLLRIHFVSSFLFKIIRDVYVYRSLRSCDKWNMQAYCIAGNNKHVHLLPLSNFRAHPILERMMKGHFDGEFHLPPPQMAWWTFSMFIGHLSQMYSCPPKYVAIFRGQPNTLTGLKFVSHQTISHRLEQKKKKKKKPVTQSATKLATVFQGNWSKVNDLGVTQPVYSIS